MERRVYTRVLQRAAEIAGGMDHLAKRLEVSPVVLWDWLDGKGQPSEQAFLKAVDIVMEHDAPKGSGDNSVLFRRPA
ncbi:MAG TPA: hypothetical protein VEB41_02905 [Burkholderiales bacterium]|nr:hypothetical protein [Burkholderiales bacterium]